MAAQPSCEWQKRLDELAMSPEETDTAEILIADKFTTVQERTSFLRGTNEEATRRVRRLLDSQRAVIASAQKGETRVSLLC